jgi:hypothetical protein
MPHISRAARALQREREAKQPRVSGFLQYDNTGEVLKEKVYAIEADGTVLESEWAPFSHTFGKRDRFKPSLLTASEVQQRFEYCGSYNID